MPISLKNYPSHHHYDEFMDSNGNPREAYQSFVAYLKTINTKQLLDRKAFVEKSLLTMGITFNVYADDEGSERIFPVDILPRLIDASNWQLIERGLKQRIVALNLFLKDIYGDQLILKDGVIDRDIVLSSKGYLPQCHGIRVPKDRFCHITGSDLIRDISGQYYVLEDNLRCPSGVAYVLENREIMKRAFSTLIGQMPILPVSDYPLALLEVLKYVCVNDRQSMALLTPGTLNSAYFEHSFLAKQMGIELVQSQDLVIKDGFVQMKTTQGFQKLDVIYRRIDDTYIDPNVFNPESLLGIRGVFDVYKKGRINFVNALGTGVADDKVVYAFVPKMIRYYLNEDPILPNVDTYLCANPKDCDYVLKNIEQLVVKTANDAGGYGMLIGPHATPEEHERFRVLIQENPRNYIAQPTLSLSTAPCLIDSTIVPRHVDLRPYVLYGEDLFVLPGGLTRVALKQGSLVVNSSQGGGSKDTWVLGDSYA